MSVLTAFLNLIKADGTEQYDVDIVNSNLDSVDAFASATDTRLDALDTTLVTFNGDGATAGAPVNGITGAANWTADAIRVRKLGKMVFVYFSLTRTTSAIASHATGNIANVALFTLPAGSRPGTDAVWGGGGGLANLMAGGMCQTTGAVFLTVIPPGIGIAIGDTISGSLCFIQEN